MNKRRWGRGTSLSMCERNREKAQNFVSHRGRFKNIVSKSKKGILVRHLDYVMDLEFKYDIKMIPFRQMS